MCDSVARSYDHILMTRLHDQPDSSAASPWCPAIGRGGTPAMSTASKDTATGSAVPGGREERLSRLRRLTLPDGVRPYLAPLLLYGTMKLVGLTVFAWLLEWAGEYQKKNPRFGG